MGELIAWLYRSSDDAFPSVLPMLGCPTNVEANADRKVPAFLFYRIGKKLRASSRFATAR